MTNTEDYVLEFIHKNSQSPSDLLRPERLGLQQYINQVSKEFVSRFNRGLEQLEAEGCTYTFLLLNTGELNAFVHRVPESNHFLIIFDQQMPTFVNVISKIFAYTKSGVDGSKLYPTASSSRKSDDISEAMPSTRDLLRVYARPAMLLLDLYFTFDRHRGDIGRELHPFGGDIIDDMRASIIRDNIYKFIFAHELGHIINEDLGKFENTATINLNGNEVPVTARGWEKEFRADEFAMKHFIRNCDFSNSDSLEELEMQLCAVYAMLESFSLQERFESYLRGEGFAEGIKKFSTHPPPLERIIRLQETFENEISALENTSETLIESFSGLHQSRYLRSAWLINETTVLSAPPSESHLKKVWMDIKSINERNNDGYVNVSPPGNSHPQFASRDNPNVVASNPEETSALGQEIEFLKSEVAGITSDTPLRDQVAMKYKLANRLLRIGSTEEDSENLMQAVELYRSLFDLFLSLEDEKEWGRAKYNAGVAAQELGRRNPESGMLAQAADFYKEALLFRTVDADPLGFARTSGNLGITMAMMIKNGQNEVDANEAVQRMSDAIETFISVKQFEMADLLNKEMEALKFSTQV